MKVFNEKGVLKMNKKVDVDKDVKFTLPLPVELNNKVVIAAEKMGLTKTAFIRMILSKEVNK
jgi:hypothetical protein